MFHGMEILLSMHMDFIIEMDTDLSHPPNQVEQLTSIANEEAPDLVICSRDIDGSIIIGWPFYRHALHFEL